MHAGAGVHVAAFGAHHYTAASAGEAAGLTTYDVHAQTPATCTCEDFLRHAQEQSFACTHILATWIYRRALAQLDTTAAPPVVLRTASDHTTGAVPPLGAAPLPAHGRPGPCPRCCTPCALSCG